MTEEQNGITRPDEEQPEHQLAGEPEVAAQVAVQDTDTAAPPKVAADMYMQQAKVVPYAKHNQPKPAERSGFKYLLKDILSVVISAVVIAIVLKTFVLDSRIVPTGSMVPTINEEDRIIMLKFPYYFGNTPARQDVVVLAAGPEFGVKEDLLKRVIGLPGDTVEVTGGKVYVNGTALVEPYLNALPNYEYGPVTVPDHCYFMLGDNRNNSNDSHMWQEPFVPFSSIKGKVVLCYWPLKDFGPIK